MTDPLDDVARVRRRLHGGVRWSSHGPANTGGRVCLLIACCEETPLPRRHGLLNLLGEIIVEQYPERARGDYVIAVGQFNDHHLTFWPDIEAVLDKAESAWPAYWEEHQPRS